MSFFQLPTNIVDFETKKAVLAASIIMCVFMGVIAMYPVVAWFIFGCFAIMGVIMYLLIEKDKNESKKKTRVVEAEIVGK